MFIRLSSLLPIFLSILCVFSLPKQRSNHDNMCLGKGGVLCVKDEFRIIATIPQGIARTAMEVEKHIQQTKVLNTLNKNVNAEMNFTRSSVPNSSYHKKFFLRNNINQEYLNQLFLEAHDAMMFFYNSIDDLLNLQNVFAHQTDQWFRKIRNNLRDDLICRYRSVLHVYSQRWKLVHQIGRIHFSKTPRLSPSFVHDIHSLVLGRYLREWMEQINRVVANLETKFFELEV